jgi:hypothetical protein
MSSTIMKLMRRWVNIYTLMAVMGSSRALARLVTVPITVSPAWKNVINVHGIKNHN